MDAFEIKPSVQTPDRLPWNKPRLERLIVSVDTQIAKPGSAADGPGAFDRLVGGLED